MRDRRASLIKDAEMMGGGNFASLRANKVTDEEVSSVDISVEENIEEIEMMEQAGHELLSRGFDNQTNNTISESGTGNQSK